MPNWLITIIVVLLMAAVDRLIRKHQQVRLDKRRLRWLEETQRVQGLEANKNARWY